MDFDPEKMSPEEIAEHIRQIAERSQRIREEADETWRALAAEIEIMDSDPHALLTFEQAVLLPELRTAEITVKKLRRAQERGELQIARIDRKNHFVSRAQIRKWIETSCRELPSRHTSSGSQANIIPMDALRRVGTSPSSTDRASSARASALSIVQKLKTGDKKPSK